MRLIRPLWVVRVCALMLGMRVCAAADGRCRSEVHAQEIHETPSPSPVRPAARSNAGVFRLRVAAPARRVWHVREPRHGPAKSRACAALQEAMTPRYKTDANGELVPDIRAAAAIIFNPANGQVLWEENAQDKRSIASITKVMTTVVFLEDNPDLDAGSHRRAERRLRRPRRRI